MMSTMKSTHTKPRSIRVPDDEWEAAQARATARGETLTDVCRRALREYAKPRQGEKV